MSKTLGNLKNAFAGESQANRRYLAFAQKAEEEGHPQIAKLFRAAAEAETVHAMNHVRTMGEVKTTADNLNAAIGGETFEFKQMYPGYIKTAKDEKNLLAGYLSSNNGTSIKNKLTEYKNWWAVHKNSSIKLL